MAKPREVTIALGMLWGALAISSSLFALAQASHFDLLPFAADSPAWSLHYVIAGGLGLVLHASCIVAVGRGHGLVRWALLLGLGWEMSRTGFSPALWTGNPLAPYLRIEPLGLAIRLIAISLLYLPRSNAWFRNSHLVSYPSGRGC